MVSTTMKAAFLAAIVLVLAGTSCRRRTPAAQTAPPATPAPATSTSPATPPGRLTSLRGSLVSKQEQYLEREGAKHRGRIFSDLVGALLRTKTQEPPVTERETFEVLGRPGYVRWSNGETTYVYLFDNYFGIKGAWLVFVDSSGLVTQIGYNTANSVGLNRFSRFPQSPSIPMTQP
jgi:hypothetical protein